VKLQSVLLKQFRELAAEVVAKDTAEPLNGQEESMRRINPSGTIEGEAASGNDVVNVWMNTSAPTIPCSRKATRSGFSILSIRFMVLLFKSSGGPSGEMAQSLSSIEAENG
jgi:hypothetical protein